MYRVMAPIFTQVKNIMKGNGILIREAAGVECTMLMVLFMKENGMMT